MSMYMYQSRGTHPQLLLALASDDDEDEERTCGKVGHTC